MLFQYNNTGYHYYNGSHHYLPLRTTPHQTLLVLLHLPGEGSVA